MGSVCEEYHGASTREAQSICTGTRRGKKRCVACIGELQARFNIVRRPARLWSLKTIRKFMKACIILHNMIVEDEGKMAERNIDLNDVPGASIVLPPEVQKGSNSNPCFDDVRRRNAAIRARPIHALMILLYNVIF